MTMMDHAPGWLGFEGWEVPCMFHHVVIFFEGMVNVQIMAGDLNFRLSMKDNGQVLKEIEKSMQEGSYDAIVAHDELRQSISKGSVRTR